MIIETNKEDWIDAFAAPSQILYQELDRIAVVKCIDSDETINTTKAHEPFRNAMPSDTDILYKWSCLCRVCLDKGFCAHVFFARTTLNELKHPKLHVRKLYRVG